MKTSEKIKSFLFIAIMAAVGMSINSCSSDNNENGEEKPNKLTSILMANKWISKDASYGEGDNNHAWVDIESTTLYFTSNNAGVSYWIQKDYDTDLGNSNTKDYQAFKYIVSGNNITITTEDNYTFNLVYSDNYLTNGSGIYEKSPMTSADHELLDKISPKTGKCGNGLTYVYYPKTHGLIISGNGDMENYTSTNQPWHNFYIESVELEDGCTSVGTNAFNGKSEVGTVLLPNTLTEIGARAFSGTTITKISIPDNVKKIGDDAFDNCTYLQTVYLSKKLEVVGSGAFANCAIKYHNLTLPDNVEAVGDFAFSGWQAGTLTLNDKLKNIGKGAFIGVKGTLTIPNSVESIGFLAFDGTFSKVVIGTGLKTLSGGAFGGSLTSGSMYLNLGKPLDIEMEVMASDNQSKWTLYVPKGSKAAYQANQYWRGFKSIVEDASLVSGNGEPDGNNENASSTTETEMDLKDAQDKRRGPVSKNFTGNGTASSPYLIQTAADLRLLSDRCRKGEKFQGKYFLMTSDITINKNVLNSYGNPNKDSNFERWIPIGRGSYKTNAFYGTFDGGNHTVSGIYINRENLSLNGLFGVITDATIKNLTVKDSYIKGKCGAGITSTGAKINRNCIIENCHNYATIETSEYGAGIICANAGNHLNKCSNHGRITVSGTVGKAGGISYAANEISNCINYGEVKGVSAGGISNYVYKITNCINKGKIIATKGAGGIGRYMKSNPNGNEIITNCLNIGTVGGDNPSAMIHTIFYGKVVYNYYLKNKSSTVVATNQKGYVNNNTEYSETELKSRKALDALNANRGNNCKWIFGNDGYPTLLWE